MADELFYRFLKIESLRRAWHLAYADARDAFLKDALGHEDFASQLEIHLRDLQRRLRSGAYEPRPLLRIDIPKSSLAVRPGATPEIEDSIVMFGIMLQIAPPLDKRFSDAVFAYRVRRGKTSDTLFEHKDLAFLRKRTRRRAAIFREWYELWPAFQKRGTDLYARRGYRFLSVSDIAAYYENISHLILRDTLIGYQPRQQRIINLLVRMLNAWSWPTGAGSIVPRGIPQGPDFSGFLANVYLMPLDRRLEEYSKRHPIRYVRYVDDVRIFSKTEDDARGVLAVMNDALRDLQLNVQGSKTAIFRGSRIEEELVDPIFNKADALANRVTRHAGKLPSSRVRKIEQQAKRILKSLRKKEELDKQESRRLRRLLTVLSTIRSPLAVKLCLKAMEEDPEQRLNEKVIRYLGLFPRRSTIGRTVVTLLSCRRVQHYPCQEAQLVELLRQVGANNGSVNRLARYILTSRKHWYVKRQTLSTLCAFQLEPSTLKEVWKLYERGENVEVRRSALTCLVSSNARDPRDFFGAMFREMDFKMLRCGRYLRSLVHENEVIQKEIASLSKIDDDRFMAEKLYKWPLFARCRNNNLRDEARKVLRVWIRLCKRKNVRGRLKEYAALFRTAQP